jgi:hypothetical protein
MANYALISYEGTVVNVIVVPDDVDETQLNRIRAANSAQQIILADPEYTVVGGKYVDGQFRFPQPYPSWTWSQVEVEIWNAEELAHEPAIRFRWTPPVPRPAGAHQWDEETLSWVSIPE